MNKIHVSLIMYIVLSYDYNSILFQDCMEEFAVAILNCMLDEVVFVDEVKDLFTCDIWGGICFDVRGW